MNTKALPLSPTRRRFNRWLLKHACQRATVAALDQAAASATGPEQARCAIAAKRIGACHASISFRIVTPPGEASRIVIRSPRGCRNAICVVCNGFKASDGRKRANELLAIVCETHEILAFLTLTQANRPLDEMPAMFAHHEQSLRRFWVMAPIRRAFLGHLTSIEIAIRGKVRREAGVHSHSIVVLHEHYLSRQHDLYLDNPALSALWGRAVRAEKPIVDIRRIRGPEGALDPQALTSAVFECVKYSVAPHKLFDRAATGPIADPDVMRLLLTTLWKRRTVRYGGVVAQAQKTLRERRKHARLQESTHG